ncbi:tubby-like F-box protein 3 isoform X1, partial [Tanacetum coccineum]
PMVVLHKILIRICNLAEQPIRFAAKRALSGQAEDFLQLGGATYKLDVSIVGDDDTIAFVIDGLEWVELARILAEQHVVMLATMAASNDDGISRGKFLLAAKRFSRAKYTDYIIYFTVEDISEESSTYMGKSKFLGTKFTVYGSSAGSYPVSRLQTFCSTKVLRSMPLMFMDTRLLRSMPLMCMDIRKVKHIAKEADSHTKGLDKIPMAAKKVERSLIES